MSLFGLLGDPRGVLGGIGSAFSQSPQDQYVLWMQECQRRASQYQKNAQDNFTGTTYEGECEKLEEKELKMIER